MPSFALMLGLSAVLTVVPRDCKADHAPRVRDLIRQADLIGVATISASEDRDHGRIRVYRVGLESDLKSGNAAAPRTIRAVAMIDQPGSAVAEDGASGVAFLKPLNRNSYLDLHLDGAAGLYEFVDGRDGWLRAENTSDARAIAGPIGALIDESRKPVGDAAVQGQNRRTLVFALLSAPHPLLARDGIDSLSSIPDLAGSLSDAEIAIIAATLNAQKIPLSSRERLIDEIVTLELRRMVPALEKLNEPALQHAAWTALRKLGAPVSAETLRDRLKSEHPRTRSAAARELLASNPSDAIPVVAASGVLRDEDRQVRLDVIEALGETAAPEAVPPLEGVFAGTDTEDRQASARALRAIGGEPANEALYRLAFAGSVDSQRYAVLMLLFSGVDRDDPRMRDIAKRHTDEKIIEVLEHGIEVGHGH